MGVKLDAVNEILEAEGQYRFSALDTGGTSVAAVAEITLDRINKEIQERGWHENTDFDVDTTPADVTKVAMVIASGIWTATTKLLTKTGAFTAYTFATGDQISVTGGTDVTVAWYEIASRTSDDAIVLKTSISDDNQTDVTTDLIGWENVIELTDDVLKADTSGTSDWRDLVMRKGTESVGPLLYDRDNNTYSVGTADIKLRLVRLLDFEDLTPALRVYITKESAMVFQRRQSEGRTQDAFLRDERDQAKARAIRADANNADHNMLDTDMARGILGKHHVPVSFR